MPLSDAQLAANRENAQHSTGPRTPEGKQRSSLNAVRHGLTSQVVVLPHEDMEAYLALHKETVKFWNPKGIHEQRLVQRLIDTDWRLNRCPSLEHSLFALGHNESAGEVEVDHPQVHAALTAGRVLRDYARQFESIGRHEFRLTRAYQSTLEELRQVQKERKAHEEQALADAAGLLQTSQMKGLAYNPAEDGFVLTTAQIEDWMGRKQRRADANVARNHGYDLKEFKLARRAA